LISRSTNRAIRYRRQRYPVQNGCDIRGLSQNSSMIQGDVGKLQMDESQVVADFLFPADKQTPRTVRPRVAAFDDPTPRTLARTALDLNFALARNVQNITQTSGEGLRGSTAVAFVQAEMLLASSHRLGTRHGHRPQRGPQQSDVVSVRAGDRNADRHAAGVRHDGSFDAQLTAIGGIFAGFFPRPTAPWSWSRPTLANASRFHVGRRRFAGTFSRSGERRDAGPIPGNTDVRCLANRTAAATLSTGSRCATDRRCRWRLAGDSLAAFRPWDCTDTWAVTARIVATFSRASAKNDYTNRNTYPPPCEEQMTFLSCSTSEAAFGSVMG
jgi:hypothetical protein